MASVSCIYGLGSPDDFKTLSIELNIGKQLDRDEFLKCLCLLFINATISISAGKVQGTRGCGRCFPAYSQQILRRILGDEIENYGNRSHHW